MQSPTVSPNVCEWVFFRFGILEKLIATFKFLGYRQINVWVPWVSFAVLFGSRERFAVSHVFVLEFRVLGLLQSGHIHRSIVVQTRPTVYYVVIVACRHSWIQPTTLQSGQLLVIKIVHLLSESSLLPVRTCNVGELINAYSQPRRILVFSSSVRENATAVLRKCVSKTIGLLQGVPKKRYPCFIFAITSVNVHRF